MNIIAFQHFSFDDPAAIAAWAQNGGHRLDVVDPSLGVQRERLADMDLLIILGGPMSVYQEWEYPWLREEKAFVKSAIDGGKKVLGICLGAQMIAEVLGGTVSRNKEKEIGWHEIKRTTERHPWLSSLPETFMSFSWHGDTFSLPRDARSLAYSEACVNQAFAYGEHVLGLQFHLETTTDCIGQMLERWADELVDRPYIQSADTIRKGLPCGDQARELLLGILDNIQVESASVRHIPYFSGLYEGSSL
ncbi:type 1 glutamine amidotransferase [Paenibacillus sp. PAMC21692]|uniref:type 1 glutamine amidotransferase n=1 Tax=Paenibacillus sp. PAMC21692 TaxID=2762320 RepID=UPI00164DDCFC|nr:type 1 glutamine amidotransferase [Paenibacillus sp. PAMC21692]QNK59669.1 type 1 glutamine amidotransferase [Paenibacillus sp. PAMC21692]